MKKKFSLLMCLVLITALLLCGCGGVGMPLAEKEKKFNIDYYNMSITATEEWEEDTNGSWDIQIKYGDAARISVMGYYTIDLTEEYTPEATYKWQNDDLFGKRENVQIVEEQEVIDAEDKTITTTLYSAERDGSKNYYYSCLVEFEGIEDAFAWVLVTAGPSYMVKNQDELMEIVKTLEYVEEGV